MKTTIISILLCLFMADVVAQKGFTNILVGYENLIDSPYEKIIDKKWIDWGDGTEAGMYYVVEYDYGEPPPDYLELVKSYVTHGFPDTIRGWVVTDTNKIFIGGDCAFISMDLIQTCINKINSKLPIYIERMSVNIPGCGGNEEDFSIKIWATEDEMQRRRYIIDCEFEEYINKMK